MSNAQKPAAPEAAATSPVKDTPAATPKTPSTPSAPKADKAPAPAAKKAVARKRPARTVAQPSAAAAKTPAATKQPAAQKAPARSSAQAKKTVSTPAVKKAKQKLVRDSFTMPSADFALIDQLKSRAIGFKRPAKKSELLRAGLQALAALTDAKLKSVLDDLTPLKSGRPKKNEG